MTHNNSTSLSELSLRAAKVDEREAQLAAQERDLEEKFAKLAELRQTRLDMLQLEKDLTLESLELDKLEADQAQRQAPAQTHGLTNALSEETYVKLRAHINDFAWPRELTRKGGEDANHAYLSISTATHGDILCEWYVDKRLL